MKILHDHCVPQALRRDLPGHDAFTAGYMGWHGLHNGRLLAAAAGGGFDVVLTVDKHMADQQPAAIPLPVIVADVPTGGLPAIRAFLPAVLALLAGPPLTHGFHWVRRP